MKGPQKKDLIKISDYIWEIPKEFRNDMHVPARIFASEEMLEELFKDKSLWQLVNMATLPGIYKYALAMPDIHEGYGFCLIKGTKILTSFGYYLNIEDLEKEKNSLFVFDQKKKKLVNSGITKFYQLKPYTEIYQIETEAGYILKATKDHPVLTKEGMKKIEFLKEGDEVAIYGVEGVPFEKPSSEIIVNEKDIYKTLQKTNLSNIDYRFKIIIEKLKNRNLIPLTYDHPKLPYLIKIMGFVFGDASMGFIGKKKDGVIHFVGSKEDLLKVKEDLEILGYKPSKIYKRPYNHALDMNASSLVVLLMTLGTPIGRKVNQEYSLPPWLFKATLWQKRLFLASLFGCELRKPHRRLKRKFGFNSPVFPMNKNVKLVENGKKFLMDIAKLCQEFGVETTKINQRRIIKTKKGYQSIYLELVFSSKLESLINLWSKIGYEYNQERMFLASVASVYLKLKKKILEERERIIKIYVSQLLNSKLSYQRIANLLNGEYISKRFISDVCYKLSNGYQNIVPRTPSNFIHWKKFFETKTKRLGKSGLVWNKITKIEKIDCQDFVYDLTVENENHNFIANSFLVSNCVGGIAAFDVKEGIISPGGVGYDIGCGIRLLVSPFFYEEIKDKIPKLTEQIFKEVPSGVGRGGFWNLNRDEMNLVLSEGAKWIVEKLGYGTKDDLISTESEGKIEGADPHKVSKNAKDRGKDQLGTIGAGNHFVEIQRVAEVYDEEIAKKLSLEKNKVAVLIHCGSRGLGHQVATDYIRLALNYLDRKNIELVDRELAYFPFESPEGKDYLSAMKSAANFAFANRQLITYEVRKAFKKVFGQEIELKQVYDVAHNIAKVEEYEGKKLIVHRKGATRSFPPKHPEIHQKYQEIGQPTLIPGSMGTSSYVLVGQDLAMKLSFGSSPHGAGRMMSRTEAKKKIRGSELKKELEKRGISVAAGSMAGLAEEAPAAYKDVSQVVEVVHNIGIAKKVVRLVPIGVIKG